MTDTTKKRLRLISIKKMLPPIFGFGLAYWIFDAIIDAFIFKEADFITSIITPDAMCLIMRLINILIIILFAFYAQLMFAQRKQVEARQGELIMELQNTLAKVKTLSGLLPICSSCKRVRNDQGYWDKIEEYISEHTNAEFTHSLCCECAKTLYPKYYKKILEQEQSVEAEKKSTHKIHLPPRNPGDRNASSWGR